MFDKLKAKGLLKPLAPRPIPNPLLSKFDVNNRCAYHQRPSHDIDCWPSSCNSKPNRQQGDCATTRPSITNNPLPNHNFGKDQGLIA